MDMVSLCMWTCVRTSSVVEGFLPFNCLNSKHLSIQSRNIVTNGCNVMKLKVIRNLSFYGNGMVMHVNVVSQWVQIYRSYCPLIA